MAINDDPLNHTVEYDGTPIFRGLALMLQDARIGDSRGRWRGVLVSADRRKGVPERYGKLSQAALYAGFIARKKGFLPANPPGRSTHELRSDAVSYKGPVGRPLAWWQLGMDVTDDVGLMAVLSRFGYGPFRPYPTGSEAHHINLHANPRSTLTKRKRWQSPVKKVIPKKRRPPRTVPEKAKQFGANYAERIYQEARESGLKASIAYALIEHESGFRNIYGGDKSPNGGTTGWRFRNVTEESYKAYRRLRGDRGEGGMQGVGPAQLTWWQLQDEADKLGGAWKATPNIRVAFLHLAALIEEYGEREGLERYNGSGPAAEKYADDVLALADKWHDRLT